MSLFGFSSKKRNLEKANSALLKENKRLRHLCKTKDSFFSEMISDGLRHGSSLAGKHMAEKRWYGKK